MLETVKNFFRRPENFQVVTQLDLLSGGTASSSGVNRFTSYNLPSAINQARTLAYSNGYAKGIINTIVSRAVGPAGLRIRFNDNRLDSMWENWRWNAQRPQEGIDELQRDIIRSMVTDGESLLTFDAESVGLDKKIFVVRRDPLDLPATLTSKRRKLGKSYTAYGVTYNRFGEPETYHFVPGPTFLPYTIPRVDKSEDLPAESCVHIYREDTPSQIRGISWILAAKPELDLLASFQASVANAVVSQANKPGGFKVDYTELYKLAAKLVGNKLADNSSTAEERLAIIKKAQEIMDDQNRQFTDTKNTRGYLKVPKGTEYFEINRVGFLRQGIIGEITALLMTAAAQSMGLSYATVTGDLSQVNFASAKADNVVANRTIRRAQRLLEYGMLKIATRWLELNGVDPKTVNITVTPPPFESLDPTKDALALSIGLKDGSVLLRSAVEAKGDNWEEHKQGMREQAELKAELESIMSTA